jgi:hypothetical protein
VGSPVKKKGRKPGSVSYTLGDLQAILDSVKEILPTQDDEWEKVTSLYNLYALKFFRNERPMKGIKSKFRELVHGAPSGGGKLQGLEKEAKDLQGLIDQKCGILVDGKGLPEDLSISQEDSATSNSEVKKGRTNIRTRMGFEKIVINQMKYAEENAQQRHKEKMELMREIFLGQKQRTVQFPPPPPYIPGECDDVYYEEEPSSE